MEVQWPRKTSEHIDRPRADLSQAHLIQHLGELRVPLTKHMR